MKAYVLWDNELKDNAIHDALMFMDNAPTLRTIKGWVREFKKLNIDDPLVRSLRWEDFGGDLPWASADYVTTTAEVVKQRFFKDLMDLASRNHEQTMAYINDEIDKIIKRKVKQRLPSVKEAQWWWRVHMTAPDLRRQEVYTLVQTILYRSSIEKVRGGKGDVGDILSFLAMKPWKSEANLNNYWTAVAMGMVQSNPIMPKRGESEIEQFADYFGANQLIYLDMRRLILWFWSGLYTKEGGNFKPMWNEMANIYEFVGPEALKRKGNLEQSKAVPSPAQIEDILRNSDELGDIS